MIMLGHRPWRRAPLWCGWSILVLAGLILAGWGCEQNPQAGKESRSPTEGVSEVRRSGPDHGSERTVSHRDPPKIVAFGNSLTAGLGVPPEQSYPALLEERLKQAGYAYEVVNAGVSGDTTAGGVRRLDWVLKSDPEIVILELGANDGLRGLDLAETRKNLAAIIEQFQSSGISVLLTGMKLPSNYGPLYTSRFESLYQELAKQYEVPFYPFFLKGVAARPSLNQADGIHPTGEGYQIIADNLFQALEPLLQNTDQRSS